MPATSESIATLPPLQRRMAEAWLMRFEENWHDQKLKDCMRALPEQSSLRRPLLMAMIERDLAHNWDAGHPTVIENYLKEFPELGGVDEIPIELIAAEYHARQKHNSSDLADFAERFPTRIDDLYLLLKPELLESGAPSDRAAINDSMSVQRLRLLRAPAEQEAADAVSEHRQKLLRSAVPNNPPAANSASETIQDELPSKQATDSDIFSPPDSPRDESLKPEVTSAGTVWLDIQTVRSNHAASRSGIIRPEQQPPPMPPAVLGRFAIGNRLGGSGFGTVYYATDTHLNRRVALKIPHFSGPNAEAIRARFQREGRAAAGLFHPLLCPVLEIGQISGLDFLATPYIDVDPLSEVLQQRPMWPSRQAVDFILKLAIAIDLAHQQGVVHRDLKPSNILIAPSETPTIVGFGQVTAPIHSQRTANAIYVAPEQSILADEPAGPRADIYSLGVILHQLLSGKLPNPVAGTYSFTPNIGQQLQAACRKATSPKPEQRYAAMSELIADLTAVQKTLRPSDHEARLPLRGSSLRAAAVVNRPTGLSAVPGLNGPVGLSAVPGFGVGQAPAPADKNTFAQMQELRGLSATSGQAFPLERLTRILRIKPELWKYLIAGAIGGIALGATILALSRGHQAPNHQEQQQQIHQSDR